MISLESSMAVSKSLFESVMPDVSITRFTTSEEVIKGGHTFRSEITWGPDLIGDEVPSTERAIDAL